MTTQKRNSNGTFSASEEKKVKISVTLDELIASKLSRLKNKSKYIEGLLFDKASEVQIVSEDWDYFEEWDALQDLRLTVNHAIQKISQYEERCEVADGEMQAAKSRIIQYLKSQNSI